MKISIEWAYPTSENAYRFGFREGCWVAEYHNALHGTTVALRGFAARNDAVRFADEVSRGRYFAAVRGKGRKWFVTAWTDDGGCLAGGDDIFRVRGIRFEQVHPQSLLVQKNFGGFEREARCVCASVAELREYFARRLCVGRTREDAGRLCETFPDHAEEIRACLA